MARAGGADQSASDVTVAQGARMLRCGRELLTKLCDDGEVQHVVRYRSRKIRYIPRSEIDRLREEWTKPASKASKSSKSS